MPNDTPTPRRNAVAELAALRESVSQLATAVDQLPTGEQVQDRLEGTERKVQRLVATLAAVVVLFGVPTAINSFANRSNSKAARDTSDTIANCTTAGTAAPKPNDPFFTGNTCYDNSQRKIAEVLGKVATNDVIIHVCLRDTIGGTSVDFTNCVTRKLAEQRGATR